MSAPTSVLPSPDTEPDAFDKARAERTIPRGLDRLSDDATPAVDTDVWLLHVTYARTRDPVVLERLVRHYHGFALALARRMHRNREPLDDLEQVACEALVLAIQRFDPERGVPFHGFASPTILGSIRRHYRDHGWGLRVSRRVHEANIASKVAAERLSMRLGRMPTVTEIAAELDISVEELLEAEEAAAARETSSLDEPLNDGTTSIEEVVGSVDAGFAFAEDHLSLQRAMAELTDRERELLGLYFFDELSQTAIGEHYGVSQMQVSRWLTITLRRLRARMAVHANPVPA